LEEKTEEAIWNCIAYVWIKDKSEDIRQFIEAKIQEKFDDWKADLADDGKHPLTCDICYQNKQIHSYAACCNNKKFCGACYKKIKVEFDWKVCPYCRGRLNHKAGNFDELIRADYNNKCIIAWIEKFRHLKPYIENKIKDKKKKVVRRKKQLIKVVETPFDSWKRKMNGVLGHLLYNAGQCYEHHQGCDCRCQELRICGMQDKNGNVCQEVALSSLEYCKHCQEQELGIY
jgi:hypothetical protein